MNPIFGQSFTKKDILTIVPAMLGLNNHTSLGSGCIRKTAGLVGPPKKRRKQDQHGK